MGGRWVSGGVWMMGDFTRGDGVWKYQSAKENERANIKCKPYPGSGNTAA